MREKAVKVMNMMAHAMTDETCTSLLNGSYMNESVINGRGDPLR
jgi:hypothetical protein